MAGGALIPRAARQPVAARGSTRAGAIVTCTVLALSAPAVALAGAHKAAPKERFFDSDGGAISCQLNDGGGLGVEAYCQTASPPRSVTMGANGTLKRCGGQGCIGNGPLNATTLPPGHSISFGPFKCTAGSAQISCRVRSGAGFAISHAGVTRL
jgi:hypothetical protein